jgi:hypothetical protein
LPDWSFARPDKTFGNRWDDPLGKYRVHYACSQPVGAYLEKLAPFRPDLIAASGIGSIAGGGTGSPPGKLPASWLKGQMLGEAAPNGEYAHLGHSRSLAFVRTTMATRLITYGITDLDAATIRLSTLRRLTQEISRDVYDATGPSGSRFAGIRYASRLGDELANWAIFESTPSAIQIIAVRPIDLLDPDLLEALDILGIELY